MINDPVLLTGKSFKDNFYEILRINCFGRDPNNYSVEVINKNISRKQIQCGFKIQRKGTMMDSVFHWKMWNYVQKMEWNVVINISSELRSDPIYSWL